MIEAAIDLGTITSRLLIASVSNGTVQPILQKAIITDMGEGLVGSGVISDSAVARVNAALLQFKAEISGCQSNLALNDSDFQTIQIHAIATSAMRDAKNSQKVLAVFSDIGIEVEIIAGVREAELSFWGTLNGFSKSDDCPVMSIDVGGGSTEIISGIQPSSNSINQKPLIELANSFNIGSRRLTDMFLTSDPPLKTEIAAAKQWIETQISGFFAQLPNKPEEIYAVAGTATTAISIRDKIVPYNPELVHGARLGLSELSDILDRLAALSLEQRQQTIGLHPGRAPVIVGGLLTLLCMLQASGLDCLTVSETDILAGVILDCNQ